MRTTKSEEGLAPLDATAPSAHIIDFPALALPPAEALLLQQFPSRYALGPNGGLVDKAKPPSWGLFSYLGPFSILLAVIAGTIMIWYPIEAAEETLRPTKPEPISLGNNFFDCLNDLLIVRSQKTVVSFWARMGPHVYLWEHVLENPGGLFDDIEALTRAQGEMVFNANMARFSGSKSVKKIVNEFENTRFLANGMTPKAEIQRELSKGLKSVQKSLQKTADYTLVSAQAIKASDELVKRVAKRAYRELNLLRAVNKEHEKWVETGVGGWWTFGYMFKTQPNLDGYEEERRMAGLFLERLIGAFDFGAEVYISTAMALQQCAANIENFTEEVQKAFSFDHYSMPISSQIEYLSPQVKEIGALLRELENVDVPFDVPNEG